MLGPLRRGLIYKGLQGQCKGSMLTTLDFRQLPLRQKHYYSTFQLGFVLQKYCKVYFRAKPYLVCIHISSTLDISTPVVID